MHRQNPHHSAGAVSRPAVRRPIRIGFVVYLLVVSVLLLTPDPSALTGVHHLPDFFRDYVAHFLLLTVLALAAHASRWPIRAPALVGLLVVYAIAIETLQIFFPPRTVEFRDFVQNLLGVAVGTVLWGIVQSRRRRKGMNH